MHITPVASGDHIRRFAPGEPAALDPSAYGGTYSAAQGLAPSSAGSVVVVPIRGPIAQHADSWWDSYESIKGRVAKALERKPSAVLLSIASPGGVVSGCFETATEIRAMAAAAGVRLHAYVDGQACSAAYALACAAETITAPPAALVGSIGVIGGLVDVTAIDKAVGLRFEIIASGKRKTDGNPHRAITDDAIAATQKTIDALATVFFSHVAAARHMTPAAVKALEAGVFTASEAKQRGLVDRIATMEEVLVGINGTGQNMPRATVAPATTHFAMPATDAGVALTDDDRQVGRMLGKSDAEMLELKKLGLKAIGEQSTAHSDPATSGLSELEMFRSSGVVALTAEDREVGRMLGKTDAEMLNFKRADLQARIERGGR